MQVLIVEDNSDEAEAMSMILEKKGYETTIVSTVSQAVEKIKEEKFNLVLLDIILPEKLGNELLIRMKEMSVNIPVVVVTAISDSITGIRKDLMKINKGIGFIEKPFNEKMLLNETKKVLEK